MSLSPDPRLAVALRGVPQARTVLGELHQQIVTCRDERTLCSLLANYFAVALAKQTPAPSDAMRPLSDTVLRLQNAIQQESRRFTTLSNASKARRDTSMNTIRNTR
jgi:hypothetical protein